MGSSKQTSSSPTLIESKDEYLRDLKSKVTYTCVFGEIGVYTHVMFIGFIYWKFLGKCNIKGLGFERTTFKTEKKGAVRSIIFMKFPATIGET